ncbi:hypothetical protein PoB_001142000 [Plakobranchus ocellatus]|uniref:Uncharacterized protein n=1 Tax=Plakobranchus ocellatus TaxID=259542 RepID=A0AAV3YQA9_9GAST|nr:hypothetical protein PoB_001142000 [Plakobranchus ocellatus]
MGTSTKSSRQQLIRASIMTMNTNILSLMQTQRMEGRNQRVIQSHGNAPGARADAMLCWSMKAETRPPDGKGKFKIPKTVQIVNINAIQTSPSI